MYSQNEEERHILEYFGATPGKFLDIGAGDGKTFSNTLALRERGWEGVLIEPDPTLFGQLRLNYHTSRCPLYMAVFAKRRTPPEVPFFYADGDFIGTTQHAHVEKWKSYAKFQEGTAKTMTCDDISHMAPFQFINVDAEGTSTDLLIELVEFMPTCNLVCVEHDRRIEDCKSFLASHGLSKVLMTNGENLIVGR